jgi:hypothetical protein
MLARVRRIMGRGALVTPAAHVTVTPRMRPNQLRLQRYAGYVPKSDVAESEAEGLGAILDRDGPNVAEIDERAGIAGDSVPTLYLDAWARLNCQKPTRVSEAEWRLALDDGGWFLDAWGTLAAELQWSADEVFDVPREGRPGGLVWQLMGERVDALGPDLARFGDGREVMRGEATP